MEPTWTLDTAAPTADRGDERTSAPGLVAAAGLDAALVVQGLGSDGEAGLTVDEAAERLRRCGPNAVSSHRARLPPVLWHQLRSPLLGLLLAAAPASAFVGERSAAAVTPRWPRPSAAHALGFQPLPPAFFAALAGMVVGYLVLIEIGKRLFYGAAVTKPPTRRPYPPHRRRRRRAAHLSTGLPAPAGPTAYRVLTRVRSSKR